MATFGDTTAEATRNRPANNDCQACGQFSIATNGTVTSMSAYVDGINISTSAVPISLGIYADNGSNYPGAFVGGTIDGATIGVGAAAGWVTISGMSFPISAGVNYWMAVIFHGTGSDSPAIYYDSFGTGGKNIKFNASAPTTFPDPYTASASNIGWTYSIYATYTPGATFTKTGAASARIYGTGKDATTYVEKGASTARFYGTGAKHLGPGDLRQKYGGATARFYATGKHQPINANPPTIAGTPAVGHVLRCFQGVWRDNGSPSFTYQWKRDGSNIASATADTYTLVAGDNTHTITCSVTDTDSVGAATASSDSVVCGPTASVTWDPSVRQVWEPDTILLLDPDQEAKFWTDATQGWIDHSQQEVSLANCNPWRVGSDFTITDGKFTRRGFKFSGTASTWIWMPGTLIPSTSWTVEFWIKADQDWATVAGSDGEQFFCVLGELNGDTFLTLYMNNVGHPKMRLVTPYDSSEREDSTLPLANTWVHLAATYDGTNLSFLVNGTVVVSALTGVVMPPLWTGSEGGITIGQFPNSKWTISDFRISRIARTPGSPVTVSSTSTVTITDTVASTTTPYVSAGIGNYGTNPTMVATGDTLHIKATAVGKLEAAVPIVAGGTDANHTVAGQSGVYSYNMGPVDHLCQSIEARGFDIFLGFGNCPQILGGSVAPRSFAECADPTVLGGDGQPWAPEVPSSMANYAKICADIYHYIAVTYPDIDILFIGTTNEPDSAGAFWLGTQTQLFDFYAAIVAEIRALNPAQQVGGPQLSSFQHDTDSWVQNMITYCAVHSTPLDFICFHMYTNHTSFLWVAQKRIADMAAAAGIATPGIIVGELGWNLNFKPNANEYPFGAFNWWINDYGATFLASSLLLHQRLGTEATFFFALVPGSATDVGDPGLTIIDSVTGKPWANGNTERLIAMME